MNLQDLKTIAYTENDIQKAIYKIASVLNIELQHLNSDKPPVFIKAAKVNSSPDCCSSLERSKCRKSYVDAGCQAGLGKAAHARQDPRRKSVKGSKGRVRMGGNYRFTHDTDRPKVIDPLAGKATVLCERGRN